ncbi:MAG TPA: hypothetical protein VE377_07655 [Candidatus Dormibacteraeota bacterium]|nr:hypothetical protein [Candidatus Dormibacteraeota bacterium]
MGIITDTKASFARYRGYGNDMKSLLSRHQVHSIDDLNRAGKDSAFQSEVAALWDGILKAEAGKISLTLILSTIAVAMGGVGIAAGGGAIGLPLLAILAPAGYFAGQELDSEGYTKAIVQTFRKLLQKAHTLDSERHIQAGLDRIKNLFYQAERNSS